MAEKQTKIIAYHKIVRMRKCIYCATLMSWFLATWYYDSLPFALCLGLSVGIHELGHLLAYCLVGVPDATFSVGRLGMTLKSSTPLSYAKQFFVAIAGPLMNVVAGLLLFILFGMSEPAELQWITALYNLLPISILDGGRMSEALFGLLCSPHWAYFWVRAHSLFWLVVLLIVSICILWTKGEGIYLFFLSFSLLLAYMFGHINTQVGASKEM